MSAATIITMEDFKTAAQQADRLPSLSAAQSRFWFTGQSLAHGERRNFARFQILRPAPWVLRCHMLTAVISKTKITVTFDDGETYQTRIDLAAGDELGLPIIAPG